MTTSMFEMNQTTDKPTHGPNPKWNMSVKDLRSDRSLGLFLVNPNSGEPFHIKIKKRKRQVVDALILNNLYYASTVLIGDIVFGIKEDDDLFAETNTLASGRKFYTLNGTVKLVGPVTAGKGGL